MYSLFSLVLIVYFSKVFADYLGEAPTNCANVFSPGQNIIGIYELQLRGLRFYAYCIPDPNEGPAWTVIQRRINGSVDFFRSWFEYTNGFGDLNGEFWLGLEHIHDLTNEEECELWVQLRSFDGEDRFAKYGTFYISAEMENYFLTVRDYYGNAGDSLSQHNGMEFYTKDRDTSDNCAKNYKGAWWMRHCYYSHLNGKYTRESKLARGIKWITFMDNLTPLQYSHMAVRPVKYA